MILRFCLIFKLIWIACIWSLPLYPLKDVVDGDYDGHTNVKVRINDVVHQLSTQSNIIYLRRILKELYPVNLNDGKIKLDLGGTTLTLMHSTVIIPRNYHTTTKGRNGVEKHSSQSQSSHLANQAFCLMHPVGDSVTGLFNLCDGLNGHYEDETFRYNIRSTRSNSSSVTHLYKVYKTSKPKGNITKALKSLIGDLSTEFSERRRRSDSHHGGNYLELYVVADYDYYNRVCSKGGQKSADKCFDKIWTYLNTVSLVYWYAFGIPITVVGMEVWTDKNLIDIPISKQQSLKSERYRYIDIIKHFSWELGKRGVHFDALLYLTSTLGKGSDTLGFAPNGALCNPPNSVAYVDDEGSDEQMLITIAHELAHLFGANHVETRNCECGRGNRCFLETGNGNQSFV